jgi:alpha-beta hydrolase superfamily lysophospholipase
MVSPLADSAVTDVLSRTWRPANPVARGAVLVLPGRGDSAAHYERFGARLAADGYLVEVADALVTSPEQATEAWRAFHASTDDAVRRTVIAVDVTAGLAAELVAAGTIPADALILAGPTTRQSEGTVSTSDIEARTSCPVHRGVLQGSEAATRDREVEASAWPAAEVTVPTLQLHGSADQISGVDAAIAATASWPAVEIGIIRGGVHDVLNDATHRTVAAEIVQFLERLRVSASAVPILERVASGVTR